ncbi:amino acid ABC transporter ATP-binding/permease protein [Shimia sp. FJ5]|uniref:amino acid ABC transporter ATP-binding/permease protein n=1 Tax=Shimia sp. FJ5 TaxID=3079054 RepID=UPI0026093AC5|nr:ATP-binding cassette domain-containing protein [Shimia sp. FJ5]MDV4146521.1 ATP-binding cassette domain-containing protein [Shimia sp. FJ5]
MKLLWTAFRLIWSAAPGAMWRGALMFVAVLLMGAALLGLSGWFITATGLAGIAGIGIAFDVFRPSAGVRLLALGRAGTRYGERLLTHDATLRALSALRTSLMRRLSRLSLPAMQRLRGPLALTRITADVDALDGIVLRLGLPVAAALLTHALVFLVLRWLTTPEMALTIALGYLLGGGLVMLRLVGVTFAPSRDAERANQTLRQDTIGMMRGRADLFVQGRLQTHLAALRETDDAMREAMTRLDRVDREAGLILSLLVTVIAGAALALGGHLVATEALDPARAAIGFFVALALGETVMPLRRGIAEIGRIRDAAERILEHEEQGTEAPRIGGAAHGAGIAAKALSFRREGASADLIHDLSLRIAPGETVALVGPSGSGKSTLLALLAGTEPGYRGEIEVLGQDLRAFGERELRAVLTMVPQRSALVGGTVFENLALAKPDLTTQEADAVLEAVQLAKVVARMGGLDGTLGESGAGLSGGESRRLVLARALLRRPDVLLLDEPTEGLDTQTAERVLAGIRAWLPEAAILMASHRRAEISSVDRVFRLS